jgi:hypothetical protein
MMLAPSRMCHPPTRTRLQQVRQGPTLLGQHQAELVLVDGYGISKSVVAQLLGIAQQAT